MKTWVAVVAVALLVVTGVAVGAAVVLQGDAPAPGPAPSAPSPELAAPQPQPPTPEEITIAVAVTEHQCSPDGGCVYIYSIEPKYVGLHPLPDEPFTVVYEVTGGHQPQVGDFTVHGGEAMIPQGVTVEGPPDAQLNAAVTDVVVE